MKISYKWILISVLASLAGWQLLAINGLEYKQAVTGGLTILIAMLWVSEALPIAPDRTYPVCGFSDGRCDELPNGLWRSGQPCHHAVDGRLYAV